MELILPGDKLQNVTEETVLGPGIYQSPLADEAIPCKAGLLVSQRKRGAEIKFIESNSRRYIPAAQDYVVGVVIGKHSEGYRVLLQDQSPPVRLDQFAFENASKKNKPNLAIGTAVYARVSVAERDIEAEIECFDATTGKAAGFGELKAGNIINVSLAFARHMRFHGHPVLTAIGEKVAYEIAIGVNGKIWVNAPDARTILKISKLIAEAEHLTPSQAKKRVNEVLSK
ncbi:exosome complex component Rrp40p [Trichomonascus vanleenenianus]|uniref:exosome non-catalytic core subunit RRP40 n=1 Tax=Trichomonascus vanleenenianus TaxID=2268995 RepID=UPI003ECA2BC4